MTQIGEWYIVQILANPSITAKSSSSCNYTCPVYNTGIKGFKKMVKRLKKGKKRKKKHSAWKVCWYDN